MSGFLDVLCEGVYRFEGTVNQFTGDGMMALFGAPIAHVDVARDRGASVFEGHALIRRAQARRLLGHDDALASEDIALAVASIEETGALGYARFLNA